MIPFSGFRMKKHGTTVPLQEESCLTVNANL